MQERERERERDQVICGYAGVPVYVYARSHACIDSSIIID